MANTEQKFEMTNILNNTSTSLAQMFNKENLPATKSFGGLTLKENAQKAENAIAKMAELERVWSRSKSEWIWKHGNMKYYDDIGNLRQISAELSSKRQALDEAKWRSLKNSARMEIKQEQIDKSQSPARKRLLEIELAEMQEGMATGMKYIEGALKDVLTLETLYDQIMERVGEFNEQTVEENESKHHIMLSVSQALRDVRESGKIGKGNAEYIEWIGLNVSKVEEDLRKAVEYERTSNSYDGTYIKDFVNKMADELFEISNKRASVMGFTRDDEYNKAIPYTGMVKAEKLEYKKEDDNV